MLTGAAASSFGGSCFFDCSDFLGVGSAFFGVAFFADDPNWPLSGDREGGDLFLGGDQGGAGDFIT